MKTQLTVLALAATTLGVMAGCKATTTSSPTAHTTSEPKVVAADASTFHNRVTETFDPSRKLASLLAQPTPSKTATAPTTKPTPTSSKTTTPSGAKIVSFTLAQKPRCPEGTAVFRAAAVPAIIKWKITGATGAALSVDDHTHTAGTYGPEPLSGSETFSFQCNGPVGSTEKHTYAIYTVGGGKQHSLTITATAKILDNGKN